MFDSLSYYDTVTVWIQGFETVKIQVEVAREKLEILQVRAVFLLTQNFWIFDSIEKETND